MITKPLTLILTLLFCSSGSVVSVENIELKEEYDEIKGKSDFEKYFVDKKRFVYKEVRYKGFIILNKVEKLRYDGAFRIQKSENENCYLEMISAITNIPLVYIGEYKLEYRVVFKSNGKMHKGKWKAKVYNVNMKHVGYSKREVINSREFDNEFSKAKRTTQFFDLNEKYIGQLILQDGPDYVEPKFQLKKIGKAMVPHISHELRKTTNIRPNYYNGLIYKINK